jgi:hypothetical protein
LLADIIERVRRVYNAAICRDRTPASDVNSGTANDMHILLNVRVVSDDDFWAAHRVDRFQPDVVADSHILSYSYIFRAENADRFDHEAPCAKFSEQETMPEHS